MALHSLKFFSSSAWFICTLSILCVLQWSSRNTLVLAQIYTGNMPVADPFGNNMVYPDNDDSMDGLFNSDKRSWYGSLYKRRGQQCGNKLCSGKCCGRVNPQCCKRGWSCRYMPRTRNFVCIP